MRPIIQRTSPIQPPSLNTKVAERDSNSLYSLDSELRTLDRSISRRLVKPLPDLIITRSVSEHKTKHSVTTIPIPMYLKHLNRHLGPRVEEMSQTNTASSGAPWLTATHDSDRIRPELGLPSSRLLAQTKERRNAQGMEDGDDDLSALRTAVEDARRAEPVQLVLQALSILLCDRGRRGTNLRSVCPTAVALALASSPQMAFL